MSWIYERLKWPVKKVLGKFNLTITRLTPPSAAPALLQAAIPVEPVSPAPFTVPANLDTLALLVRRMAESGEGTDACLDLDCLPMLVHYYSPVPDIKDLHKREIWTKVADLTGIDFNVENQLAFLAEVGAQYGRECDWPLDKTANKYQFFVNNNSFNFGCAASLHTIIRHFRPKRIIEIGSGNSSRVISAAVSENRKSTPDHFLEYTIVDPYPDEAALFGLPNLTHIKKDRVELLDPSFFNQLEENDLLFIDSGHSVKIGGDVNYLILQILPRLAHGVVIHFHDIPLPYEYPEVYYTNPAFRMFWTESYLLQAFLSFNSDFEILLGMAYLMVNHLDVFSNAFPMFDPKIHEASAGSFWIRRKASGLQKN